MKHYLTHKRFLEEALETVLRAKKALIDSTNHENIINYQLEVVSFWESKATGRIDYLGNGSSETRLMWSYEWLEDYFVVADEQNKIIEFINNSYGIKPKDMVFKRTLFINTGKQILIRRNRVKDIEELISKPDIPIFYNFLSNNNGTGLILLSADNGVGPCLLSLKLELLSGGIKPSRRNIKRDISSE